MVTLTSRVIDQVNKTPGLSAWSLAKKLKANSGTVSGILHKLASRGDLERYKSTGPKPAWLYYPQQDDL